MTIRTAATMALAAATLALAACGDGGQTAERPAIGPVIGQGLPAASEHPATAALDGMQRAFAAGDFAALCSWITPRAAEQAGEAAHGDATTCPRDLRRLSNLIRDGGGWRRTGSARTIAVAADGMDAEATIALDRRWQAEVPLTRRNGRWQVSGLFGSTTAAAERAMERTPTRSFPQADRGPVAVSDASGAPCPALAGRYPTPMGGCEIRLRAPTAPLTVLTPIGDFDLARCRIEHRIRVDAEGRTWTTGFQVVGGPKGQACGDVESCYDLDAEASVPWRGRITGRGGDSGFVHRVAMCLQTCVGYFVGELRIRLSPDGDGWRADPIDGGGSTGFRFEEPLAVSGEVRIEPVAQDAAQSGGPSGASPPAP